MKKNHVLLLLGSGLIIMLLVVGCGAVYSGKDAGREGRPWTRMMGQGEYFDWENQRLSVEEKEWMLRENKKAQDRSGQPAIIPKTHAAQKVIFANFYFEGIEAKVYKIGDPFPENKKNEKEWYKYVRVISQSAQIVLGKKETVKKSLPLGYYAVVWERDGRFKRVDPLMVLPNNRVDLAPSIKKMAGCEDDEAISGFVYYGTPKGK